ncbi:MAG: T9SS type A sorting domain-containing protein [Bacteroidia bacterium]
MKTLITLTLSLFCLSAFAQIEIEKDSTFFAENTTAFEIAVKSKITNNSSDTLFTFIRKELSGCDFPETAFCDQSLCYAADQDTAEHVVIKQNESFDLKVNFYPYEDNGCCAVVMYIISETNPNNQDSCYFEACNILSTKNLVKQRMQISFDPISDQIALTTENKSAYGVKIFNILGAEVVKERAILDGDRIDVKSLPSGVYVVQVDGEIKYSGLFRKL